MKMDMLDTLLHVSINGPAADSDETGTAIEEAVKRFMSKKRRVQGKMSKKQVPELASAQESAPEKEVGVCLSAAQAIDALGLSEYSEHSMI